MTDIFAVLGWLAAAIAVMLAIRLHDRWYWAAELAAMRFEHIRELVNGRTPKWTLCDLVDLGCNIVVHTKRALGDDDLLDTGDINAMIDAMTAQLSQKGRIP